MCRRMASTMRQIRDMSGCVVCGDECTQVVRCSNNHACCMNCHTKMSHDTRCPMCREPRCPGGNEILSLMTTSGIHFECKNCGKQSTRKDHEHHRAWCPRHEFDCPIGSCGQNVTLSEMANHAMTHGAQRVDLKPFAVAFTKGDVLFFVVGNALVVISSNSYVRRLNALDFTSNIPLCMKAYYASPEHQVLSCTILHHSLSSFSKGAPNERLSVGPIPAVLASHEHTVFTSRVPVIVPFCCQGTTTIDQALSSSLVYTEIEKRDEIEKSLRRFGVRDIPVVANPTNIHRFVGLVELQFSIDPVKIGDLYRR